MSKQYIENVQQFEILRAQVSDRWLDIQKYKLAFDAASQRNQRYANYTSWATIVAGAFTGGSGALELFGEFDELLPEKITAIGAVLTAVLAGVNQKFNWAGAAKELWHKSNDLDKLQKEFQGFISDIAMNPAVGYDATFLNRKDDKISAIKQLRVAGAENFADEAEKALRKHHISTLPVQFPAPNAGAVAVDDDEEVGDMTPMMEETPGVLPRIERGGSS